MLRFNRMVPSPLWLAFSLLILDPSATDPIRPSISDEDLFGKTAVAAQQALDYYGPWDDDAAARRVTDLGYRLAAQTGFTDFPLTFSVVDMREPNAFALPGGQIFVTRGMLELGLDDDQLAGLLGHEIAHVTLEHGTKMQKRARLLNALGQAAMVGVLVAADSIGGERAPEGVPLGRNPDEISRGARIQGALAATMILSELLMRGYNREFEDQADAEGQRMAAAAGFDPHGADRLFDLMEQRLPQSREYGYWRTHPFFTDRIVAARARADQLAILTPKPDAPFRQATQDVLLAFDPTTIDKSDEETQQAVRLYLEATALAAWPSGPTAERLRDASLQRLRETIEETSEIQRDYGRLLQATRRERAEVAELTPDSDFLAALDQQIAAIEQTQATNYPAALRILDEGVYQTEFLAAFLSNYPDSPRVSAVALKLATSYARMQRTRDSIEHYLKAWRAAPDSELGQQARRGLEILTPQLEDLTALAEVEAAAHEIAGAAELESAARARLDEQATRFVQLENGALYLQRFPEGSVAPSVTARLETQAEKLYGEVILYQGIGDSLKALDRIREILTYAPESSAARRLSERAVLG